MSFITLEVLSAKLGSELGGILGERSVGQWSLTLKVKLPFPERLELGTGEKVSEVEMYLTFRDADPERTKAVEDRTRDIEDFLKSDDDKVIGLMSYHGEAADSLGIDFRPATVLFEIYTPPDLLASLVRFAENGRFVKRLDVEARGLKYGYSPDGREKRWLDNKDHPMLPVVGVRYELPVGEEQTELRPGEPLTPVGADLAPILRELLRWLKGAVYLLAAVAAALVLKSWR